MYISEYDFLICRGMYFFVYLSMFRLSLHLPRLPLPSEHLVRGCEDPYDVQIILLFSFRKSANNYRADLWTEICKIKCILWVLSTLYLAFQTLSRSLHCNEFLHSLSYSGGALDHHSSLVRDQLYLRL